MVLKGKYYFRWGGSLSIAFMLMSIVLGCVITMGARFDSSQVTRILPGETTKAEIQELLGKPASEGLKNGNPLWTYLYARVPLLGGAAKGTVVSIEFDEKGIVETYSYIPY